MRGHGASQGPETREAEEAEDPEGGTEARGDGGRAPARPRGLRLLPLLLFPQGAGLRGSQCPGAGTEGRSTKSRDQYRESRNNAILRNLLKKITKVTPRRGRGAAAPSFSSLPLPGMIRITFQDSLVSWFGWFFFLISPLAPLLSLRSSEKAPTLQMRGC